uniref:Uncharacterized protein n=1 Tax=Rhizophora mucronata TaxID=61149 RepID=A0A2P2Q6Z0_RHIMU
MSLIVYLHVVLVLMTREWCA